MKKVIDLGKIGITLAGEYNDKVTYEKLTIVLRNGKSYISKKESKGVLPETDTAQKNWQLVAEAKDAYHMLVDAGKTTLTEEEFLEQLVDATKGRYIVQGNVINTADEEDLTVEHSSLLGIDTLKLADRPSTDGMGYIILRKNKTFAEQVTKTNTIYEIRYEFDLNNANIIIPEGCILKFNGGSVSNGTLNGNKTSYIDSSNKCLDNITLLGFKGVIKAAWFGNKLEKIFPFVHNCELHLDNITYNLSEDILVEIGTKIIGHGARIISNSHIYLGWRATVEGVHFEATNPNVECLTIQGDKIWESRQHYRDYEDKEFLIIGTKISNCVFDSKSKAIVFDSRKVDYGNDAQHFDGSGFSFHVNNNQFNQTGDDTIVLLKSAGWFTAFEFTENVCNSRNIFLHAITSSSAITGINIVRNDIQLGENNLCAIKLEAASWVNILENRIWDYYDGAIELSKLNCEAIVLQFLPLKGDVLTQYIKYFDKEFSGTTKKSSVNTNGEFVGYLPSPKNTDEYGNKYYNLVDFYEIPCGNYAVSKVNAEVLIGDFTSLITQGLRGNWILNVSRPIHRQIVLTLTPTMHIMGYGNAEPCSSVVFKTCINTESSDYISSSLKISKSIWSKSIVPFEGTMPQVSLPGLVYVDSTYHTLAYCENNTYKSYDGSPLGTTKYGDTSSRPSLSSDNIGFQYYDTNLQKPIFWTGGKWVDAIGTDV